MPKATGPTRQLIERLREAIDLALDHISNPDTVRALLDAHDDAEAYLATAAAPPSARELATCPVCDGIPGRWLCEACGGGTTLDKARESAQPSAASPAPAGAEQWRCFHCDDVFTDRRQAELHFGSSERVEAACKIKAGAEGSLLEALRRAEADAGAAWRAIHEETTDAARAHYTQQDRHQTQLRVAEEAGYERGLADFAAERDRAEGLERELAEAKSYLLADEERRKLTGDALAAEAALYDSDWFQAVLDFHHRFGQLIQALPAVPTTGTVDLRLALCGEEWREFEEAMQAGDLPAIADAIVDLTYVLLGTGVSYGIDLRPVWRAVHAANMAKVGGAVRGDGKILKPEGWQPPDVAGVLAAQEPLLLVAACVEEPTGAD